METKPPTRTLPKLVMKEWPHVYIDKGVTYVNGVSEQSLSSFTRVGEDVQKENSTHKAETET